MTVIAVVVEALQRSLVLAASCHRNSYCCRLSAGTQVSCSEPASQPAQKVRRPRAASLPSLPVQDSSSEYPNSAAGICPYTSTPATHRQPVSEQQSPASQSRSVPCLFSWSQSTGRIYPVLEHHRETESYREFWLCDCRAGRR